jgi:hypothetical protein
MICDVTCGRNLDSARYVAIVPRMLLADRDAIYLGLATE